MNLIVKNGQSIFDVAITAYQDASRVYDLITSNPEIDSINSDLTGMDLYYVESKITQKQIIKLITVAQKTVIIGSLQTLFDISLQYGGSAEKVYDFIRENGIDSINSDPTGINLKYTISNDSVSIYFRRTGKNVATKSLAATENTPASNFLLRTDGGRLLRTDGGRIPRL